MLYINLYEIKLFWLEWYVFLLPTFHKQIPSKKPISFAFSAFTHFFYLLSIWYEHVSQINQCTYTCTQEKMLDAAFIPRNQQQCQESSKYILLPAKVQSSRYYIRAKPCKYIESVDVNLVKNADFFTIWGLPELLNMHAEIFQKFTTQIVRKLVQIITILSEFWTILNRLKK